MGYACPVCGDPQQDAGHLANHLAFTAMLGDDDHEAWLDEHTPGWGDQGERELAERVADRAEAVEFPQVFEDTTGGPNDPAEERSGALFEDEGAHGNGHQHGPEHDVAANVDADRFAADSEDPETAEILEEAREMTREMLGGEKDADDRQEDVTEAADAADGVGDTPDDAERVQNEDDSDEGA